MRIHVLDGATIRPPGAVVLPEIFSGRITARCLLVETGQGLLLVDTGCAGEAGAHHHGYRELGLGVRRGEPSVAAQIRDLGLEPRDVRHILLTHMDFDHTAGLPDFPDAMVHVCEREYQTATRPRGVIGRSRRHGGHVRAHEHWSLEALGDTGTSWCGADGSKRLELLGQELWMVPLFGHTPGHCGVAVALDDGGWLLHAGDVAYSYAEMRLRKARPFLLRAFQRSVHFDISRMLADQERVWSWHESEEIRVLLSHDPDAP